MILMDKSSNQAKAIFLAAIESRRPEQWSTFLEQSCAGDTSLRTEVDRLLRARAAIGSFHEASGFARSDIADGPTSDHSGAVVGPYTILEQLGEGGFGIVYKAEQQEPIRRNVAVKVLKPGMDTRQIVARFEAERQALALMDHPHIARVLDAGVTNSGRPYFVMELVKGVPITDYCDANRLRPDARLRLFVDVCRAIEHAHHKGVIHRDIKPSNVLVALHEGAPVVKVIDFGVAKATAQRPSLRTLVTAHGQMVGTPAYMSPEQAEMNGLDIDTRSDVYSLGVLLYELLAGTTPLESKGLSEVGYGELQRLVCEAEAPRPSALVLSQGDSAIEMAANRRLDVKRLVHLLAGDLDWVVMKALEKDRDRRYDTPGALAEDVTRHLRGETVRARPPSIVYKVKKFVRRHRTAVLTGLAMVVAIKVGAGIAMWQAVVATRAKQEALGALAAESDAKRAAQEEEVKARAVLQFFMDHVLAAARPKGKDGGLGRDVSLEQAVEAALPYVENSFKAQPLIQARLRLSMGASFFYLGKWRTAVDQFEAARALYVRHSGHDDPDTLGSMNNLANSYEALGRYADALKLREETLALVRAKLGPDHPTALTAMNNLANSYEAVGRQAEALKFREETLRVRKERLGTDHPDTLMSMNNLANSYYGLGRHADALKLYEETLVLTRARLGPSHPNTLGSMNNLAICYAALDRHAEALQLREETLALRQTELGPRHPDTLTSMNYLANSYVELGRHVEALKLREETLALRQAELGRDHPDSLWSMWMVARSLVQLGRGGDAVPVIDECIRRASRTDVPPGLLAGVMDLRLRLFQMAGDAAGCRQTAAMREGLNRTDVSGLYTAACMRAIAAAVTRAADTSTAGAKLADDEADKAMVWLSRAVAAGYKDAAHLKQDKDLDALRGRTDFTKLLTGMEGAHYGTPNEEQMGR
jgi:serine/threonine protein kinase/tetratricopeptide (TPR) repeat protein